MGEIVDFHSKKQVINVEKLQSKRIIDDNLISKPEKIAQRELAIERTSEPIKSMDDIISVSQFLISNKRWRDNMLFIVGINFGLRVSDLLTLRFSDLINENNTFKDSFPIFEIKTKNTRKKRTNRYISINDAVVDAVTMYLQNTKGVCLNDYLFKSESNNGKNTGEHLSAKSVDRILKGIAHDCKLTNKMSTHSLRKTFGYHQMVMSGNEPRKLLLLQKMFNHSSMVQTLDYIGITEEEIDTAYKELNLGSVNNNYMSKVEFVDKEVEVV